MIKYLDIRIGEFTNICLNSDEFRLELVNSDKDSMSVRINRNDVTDMLLMFEEGISNYRCTIGLNGSGSARSVIASVAALKLEENSMVLELNMEEI